MTTTSTPAKAVPVRLDFDRHAAGFARALAHLDQAKDLGSVGAEIRTW